MSKKNKKIIFKRKILFNTLGQIKLKSGFKPKNIPFIFQFISKGNTWTCSSRTSRTSRPSSTARSGTKKCIPLSSVTVGTSCGAETRQVVTDAKGVCATVVGDAGDSIQIGEETSLDWWPHLRRRRFRPRRSVLEDAANATGGHQE